MSFSFFVVKRLGKARFTELKTPHGVVHGPFFQFVATQAAIRGMVFSEDLEAMGVEIILANTYHLHLRPGEETIAAAGGLHGFMNWNRPIITDSGGYQVFSLGKRVKLDADGVTFQSPLDGGLHRLTPESAMEIQAKLGADIIMPLDVCTPFGASEDEIAGAVEQTTAWAKRCKEKFEALKTSQVLYGIVQGGVYSALRQKSVEALREIGFFGYSIGGELREGEENQVIDGLKMTVPHLPEDAPRYLMGSGSPEDIVGAVRQGVDQFDCVWPIRNARHAQVYYDLNRAELAAVLQDSERPIEAAKLYRTVDLRKANLARDFTVFSRHHPVIQKPYTMSYVHHLYRAEAPSGFRLGVLHNIYFYVQLMQAIQEVIRKS